MALLIQQNDIQGLTVYGQQQVDYSTADGKSGLDYASVVALASTKEASAIEEETEAYLQLIQTRQEKLQALGDALAILTEAIATLPTSNQESSDETSARTELSTARTLLNKYGISLAVSSDNTITRSVAMEAQTEVQYAIDTEDNDLQQDLVTLQGLVSKRDNAYSTAANLVSKTNSTADTLISQLRH